MTKLVTSRASILASAGRADAGPLVSNQFQWHPDLERRVGTSDGCDVTDSGQRRLVERPLIGQGADRTEREHGQVEVARYALLKADVQIFSARSCAVPQYRNFPGHFTDAVDGITFVLSDQCTHGGSVSVVPEGSVTTEPMIIAADKRLAVVTIVPHRKVDAVVTLTPPDGPAQTVRFDWSG